MVDCCIHISFTANIRLTTTSIIIVWSVVSEESGSGVPMVIFVIFRRLLVHNDKRLCGEARGRFYLAVLRLIIDDDLQWY